MRNNPLMPPGFYTPKNIWKVRLEMLLWLSLPIFCTGVIGAAVIMFVRILGVVAAIAIFTTPVKVW